MPKPETVSAFLGGRGGVSSALAGTAIGLVVPACSCGVIPLAVAAVDSGASVSGAVALTFVSSGSGIDSFFHTVGKCAPLPPPTSTTTPGATGIPPPPILTTTPHSATRPPPKVGQGGYSTALMRMAAVSVLGIVSTITAWLFSKPSKAAKGNATDKKGTASCGTGEGACCPPTTTFSDSSSSSSSFLVAGFEGVLGAYEEVIVYIFFGVAITALMHAWEPDDGWGFASVNSGAGDLLFRVTLLSASLPLQMCEHAVVNLAKAMVDAGVSAGTAFAWLVVSPGMESNVPTHVTLSSPFPPKSDSPRRFPEPITSQRPAWGGSCSSRGIRAS